MTTRVDISIGPVQGFVSQSRRTRDLWGSSCLLAFLSAHAMRGAVEAGGRLVVPAAEAVEQDRLYQWVTGCRDGEPPRIGSLPNHCVVEVEGNGSEVARAGIRSLRTAWEQVCHAVWSSFVEPACPIGNGTGDIWKRQTDSFWEIMWTAGDADAAGGLLARRKHWRSHHPPEEPGDKCTVMHTLQELSGFVRAQDRMEQDAFWDRIRNRLGPLDLRDNERLGAIAFVKRMFPKVAAEALGWEVDASRWPSTVYVGAVPWMCRVKTAVPRQAADYADAVMRSAGSEAFPMRRPRSDSHEPDGNFRKLDANYLHSEFVMDELRCPLPGQTSETSSGVRGELAKRLRLIYEATDEQGRRLGSPPFFYALLLADGDRLGRLVSDLKGEFVSEALAEFTRKTPEIVRDHDGVAVYAGGDDVLAMLPTRTALACATALSDAYRRAFAGTGRDTGAAATLSAAVVFAHVRLPLNHVLGEAHRLLDDVAKDGNGRDSLAAAVLKPGGPYCEWVSTWTRRGPEGEACAVGLIEALSRQLEVAPDAAQPGLSSALVYRIRDLFARLCGWEQWRPGSWGDVPGDIDLHAFLRTEIAHSLETRMDDGAAARAESTEQLTAGVWNLLSPAGNPQGVAANARDGTASPSPGADAPRLDGGASTAAAGSGSLRVSRVGVDGLLLARFLADPEEQEFGR